MNHNAEVGMQNAEVTAFPFLVMKIKSSLFILFCMGLLGSLLASTAQAQTNPTAPQVMPIGLAHPKPAKQTGLRRPQGDGNLWTFEIAPEAGIKWVEGPTWSYPGKGAGADPAWGQWGGGDGQMWLSWISPEIASAFTIKVTGKILPDDHGHGGGTGVVTPIDIEASWEGEVLDDVSINIRRKGSGDAFSGEAIVAAGGVASEEHLAEIEVAIKDANGNPRVGIEVPPITIKSGGRAFSEDQSIKVPTPIMYSDFTDANGKAYGTFMSGNWTEDTILQIEAGKGTNNPTAKVIQVWNQVPDVQAWFFDANFMSGESTQVAYQMAFGNGFIPITGHAADFHLISISGLEWDAQIGDDADEDGVPDGDFVIKTYSYNDSDLTGWNKWRSLVVFNNHQESDGLYSVSMTPTDGLLADGEPGFLITNVDGFVA